uniref:Uncharacterized protein n=1 Tax=Panagrolaimus sp. PS1159 TaxID=55785 RepID=A0AC35FAN9_9BILA
MALIAGVFFGLNLLPIIEVQDNEELYPNAPKGGLPYIFSQCVGAFITSSIAFFTYALIRRNNVEINPKVTIPALISGFLWAIGETLLINATSELSAAITYPISAKLPGCVAALWSIFYFILKKLKKGRIWLY